MKMTGLLYSLCLGSALLLSSCGKHHDDDKSQSPSNQGTQTQNGGRFDLGEPSEDLWGTWGTIKIPIKDEHGNAQGLASTVFKLSRYHLELENTCDFADAKPPLKAAVSSPVSYKNGKIEVSTKQVQVQRSGQRECTVSLEPTSVSYVLLDSDTIKFSANGQEITLKKLSR